MDGEDTLPVDLYDESSEVLAKEIELKVINDSEVWKMTDTQNKYVSLLSDHEIDRSQRKNLKNDHLQNLKITYAFSILVKNPSQKLSNNFPRGQMLEATIYKTESVHDDI